MNRFNYNRSPSFSFNTVSICTVENLRRSKKGGNPGFATRANAVPIKPCD